MTTGTSPAASDEGSAQAPADGGSASDGGTAGDEPAASGSGDTVEISDFNYLPENLTVEAGTTVTWTNEDTAPHTATLDDRSEDTDSLSKGDSGDITFDEPGQYAYFCLFHPFMKGEVTVK